MTTPQKEVPPPVVCRFAAMSPRDLLRFEMHRSRTGGDLGHVDKTRSHRNKRLIGKEDWARRALNLLEARKAENFFDELTSLKRRNRKKQLLQRSIEGPHDPWRTTRHGPMREVILTASKAWFEAAEGFEFVDGMIDLQARERLFEERAVAWLKKTFGGDVVHARADRDEGAYHIHAVIIPWQRVTIKGSGRWMLQPSKHEVIKDYEVAQDRVGTWFATIGLTRGQRRKQAFRDAIAKGETPPKKRQHVRPAEYRRKEEVRLAKEAEALEARAELLKQREAAADAKAAEADATIAEGEAMIAGAEGIADGSIEIYTTSDGPRLRPVPVVSKGGQPKALPAPLQRSTKGHARIAAALAKALRRIKGRAEIVAQARTRAALARQIADVEAVSEAVVGIVALLPEALRTRIAGAHKILTARIFTARKSLGAPAGSTNARGARDRNGRGGDK